MKWPISVHLKWLTASPFAHFKLTTRKKKKLKVNRLLALAFAWCVLPRFSEASSISLKVCWQEVPWKLQLSLSLSPSLDLPRQMTQFGLAAVQASCSFLVRSFPLIDQFDCHFTVLRGWRPKWSILESRKGWSMAVCFAGSACSSTLYYWQITIIYRCHLKLFKLKLYWLDDLMCPALSCAHCHTSCCFYYPRTLPFITSLY